MPISPADLAAMRLELSPGELRCPKKGQIAKGRCVQLQEELACTCSVAVAAGCAIGPVKAGELEPTERPRVREIESGPRPMAALPSAPASTPSPARRRDLIERAARRLAEDVKEVAAAPREEEPMAKGPDAVRAAMEAEPDREWAIAELMPIHGGTLKQANDFINNQSHAGVVKRVGRGVYRWPTATSAKKPNGAPAPKKAKEPAAKSIDQVVDNVTVLPRLRWLADGLVAGHMAEAEFIEKALGALGVQR